MNAHIDAASIRVFHFPGLLDPTTFIDQIVISSNQVNLVFQRDSDGPWFFWNVVKSGKSGVEVLSETEFCVAWDWHERESAGNSLARRLIVFAALLNLSFRFALFEAEDREV